MSRRSAEALDAALRPPMRHVVDPQAATKAAAVAAVDARDRNAARMRAELTPGVMVVRVFDRVAELRAARIEEALSEPPSLLARMWRRRLRADDASTPEEDRAAAVRDADSLASIAADLGQAIDETIIAHPDGRGGTRSTRRALDGSYLSTPEELSIGGYLARSLLLDASGDLERVDAVSLAAALATASRQAAGPPRVREGWR